MNYAWYFDFDKNFMSVPRGHRSIKMAVRPVWGDRVAVTGISLDRSSSTLALTSTPDMFSDVLLSATVYPQDAFEKGVAWSSSNPGVAWVFDGHVVAVSKGTTTITATSTDGGFTATCEVLVK
ncbi:MAG: Ig domain-containing protein [Bacteroidales bacterium]|nr:Ig domain-containing protein [Bacteroidales bacterium]